MDLFDDLHNALEDTKNNIIKYLDLIQQSVNTNRKSNNDDVMRKYDTVLDQKLTVLHKDEIVSQFIDLNSCI